MQLKELRMEGFKSFVRSTALSFPTKITGIVGPNGSGKSNITEAFRFVLGEQSMKTLRGKRGEDLIFNGGIDASRSNKASVSVIFDNSLRTLNDTFDEVSVSRTVYRDGSNEYMINGTQVRHRDVVELLATANIGSTGHHIISQGESDRILNASVEERKEMIEDGLGLKLLQYRRNEAEKKLTKAHKNIAESDLIIREITPHMRHLKRQVDEYEKTKSLRKELKKLYAEYLIYETTYISEHKWRLQEKADALVIQIADIDEKIEKAKKQLSANTSLNSKELEELRLTIQSIREKKDAANRELGHIEGKLSAITSFTTEEKSKNENIARNDIQHLHDDISKQFTSIEVSDYGSLIKSFLSRMEKILQLNNPSKEISHEHDSKLQKELLSLQSKVNDLEKKEQECIKEDQSIRDIHEKTAQAQKESEQTLFALATDKNSLEKELTKVTYELQILKEDEEHVEEELSEGSVLIGDAIHDYKNMSPPDDLKSEPREKQKNRRRTLERKKIELESNNVNCGEDTYSEYEEVSNRITFLSREKEDLLLSIADCQTVIEEIEKEITSRFKVGITKISIEFEKFFKILFGGGSASVSIEKRTLEREDEKPEVRVGVGVKISLPRKRINSLEQLSGGERALVSIALLFAISQVAPPPFLILDETDAALDEANSKRYGDMISVLAKKSQLILVTHNRETMCRAGALYGITMNTSGASTLLSIQFEEAVQAIK